jgi:glycosyltransferase involved in cell wall biosynthesis
VNVLVLAPHPFFQNRGTPIAVRALVEALTAGGHVVDLLVYHEGEPVDMPGVRIHRTAAVPAVRDIRPGFSIQKLVCDAAMFVEALRLLRGRRGPDLLHAVEESAFLALALRRIHGIPYVYDMDSSLAQQMMEKYAWLERARGFLEGCERLAVRESTGVVAVCRSLEETARSYQGDKPVLRLEDFTLLRSGQRPPGPEDAFAAIPRPLAMYVGNLEPYQGIDLLLEAFRVVTEAGAAGSLVVVGGRGEDVLRYGGRVRELALDGRVFFAGPRPIERLAATLHGADVLVSPRIQGSNTPMKIYSYLDSERPLVATRLPTHTQVLDAEIALLVEPQARAMGEGLLRLFRDRELGRQLAASARRRVEQEFTPEAYRRKLLGFYGEIERRIAAAAAAR